MSVLGEVAEFVKGLQELLNNSKPEAVLVVVLGSAAIGAIATRAWARARGTVSPPSTCDERHISTDDAATLDRVKALLGALDKSDSELWHMTEPQVPLDLLNKIHLSGMRVLTFANLKGGVGKTTLAANMAAYFSRPDPDGGREKPYNVLLIDFDYQGNLSATVQQAAGVERDGEADRLLAGRLTASDLTSASRRLLPKIPNLSLIPANFELGRQENRLLMRQLLQADRADPRFSLLRLLADDEVLSTFQLVVIDTPPRLTLGTIAGLAASTHVVIPTILDNGSVGNVLELIKQLDRLFRKGLNPRLELAGIIGTKTTQKALAPTESAARVTAERSAQEAWAKRAGGIEAISVLEQWPADAYVFDRSVPVTARFRDDAGRAIAYLDDRAHHETEREFIADLGRQIAKRIMR